MSQDRVIEIGAEPLIIPGEEADERPIAPADVGDALTDYCRDDAGDPVPVSDAIETYLRFNQAARNTEERTSRYERACRYQYARVMVADRHFQMEYNLTTALLTRRTNPLDDSGNLLTPWEMDERLHGEGVHAALRNAFRYHLESFAYEWCAVTSPRRLSGTPEEFICVWIDDPDDTVAVDHLEPALDRHIDYSPGATAANHPYQTDGSGGAIRIEHVPSRVPDSPEELETTTRYADDVAEFVEHGVSPSRSAYHIATNLPDLVVGDYYDPDVDNPPATLLEGAAAAWVVPHEWFRMSGGVPALSNH